jgi:hypothetical protein
MPKAVRIYRIVKELRASMTKSITFNLIAIKIPAVINKITCKAATTPSRYLEYISDVDEETYTAGGLVTIGT